MKGKLKSIGRVAMALVLATSLSLVAALPAAAQPSIYYVATDGSDTLGDGTETWVDTNGDEVWDEGEPGPWLTIQHAIDQAVDGDTIIVADGIFAESLVVGTANLTIKSVNGRALTTIQNVGNAGGEQTGILLLAGATNFTLGGSEGHGFTIEGGTDTAPRLIQLNNGPSGVEFSYNTFDSSDTAGTISTGINIGAGGATGLIVDNNIFIADEDASYQDWPLIGGPTDPANPLEITVTDNEFTGSGTPGKYGAAIALDNVGVSSLDKSTISGNTINDFDRGITIGGTGSELVISQNTISGCTLGIRLRDTVDVSSVAVTENNISGNIEFGLLNQAAAVVTAENNWWGDASGPTHSDNPLGLGDVVSDNVNFIPWWDAYPSGNPAPTIDLDLAWYKTGDEPVVTVYQPSEDTKVLVNLSSTLASQSINIWADEDPENAGQFEASFTLVNSVTGVGQLLVIDGDTVTATYSGGIDITDSATVDDTLPVVAIDTPSNEDYVAGNVPIAWTITDTNQDSVELLINDVVVEEAESGDSWLTNEIVELVPTYPDGSYTIEVVATDLAGNVVSASIDVTVDNTEPVIGDQSVTPAVVEPDVENTIVFTAAVTEVDINTVTIDLSAIDEASDVPMLDDGVDSDVIADDGIYTAEITTTLAEQDDPYALTVTATDLAGNVNETAEISIVCSSDIVAPVITDPAITYPFVGVNSAQPGEAVTISVTVTDLVGMGSVTATCAVVTEAAGEETVLVVIALLDDGEGESRYTGTATVDSDAGWGDYPVTITAADAKGNVATDETLELAVRVGATGVEIDLVVGWNLISLPLIPDDADISEVISATTLASEDVSNVVMVRAYDPATGEFPYHTPATGSGELTVMEDGVGYWVFMNEADTLTITGRQWPTPPMELPSSYDVVVGWNLIGFRSMVEMPDYDVVEEGVEVGYLANIAGTYPVLWSYDAFAGAYSNVKNGLMEVGHGFWIWMTEPGTIVPPGPPPEPEEP